MKNDNLINSITGKVSLFKFYKKFGFKSKGNKSNQDLFRIIKKESA